jgi:hypothetical protein
MIPNSSTFIVLYSLILHKQSMIEFIRFRIFRRRKVFSKNAGDPRLLSKYKEYTRLDSLALKN